VKILGIEDVRVVKRSLIVDRAKELLENMLKDSKEVSVNLAESVKVAVQVQEILTYGPDKLPAGPNVQDSDAIIVVEGRNDVLNLLKAGIKNAKGLVAVLATDADHVYIVLTARQMNQDMLIIARAGTEKSKSKLVAAGADKVESPYEMGAISMAQRLLRPTVTSFLDLAFARSRKDIQMEEIPVKPDSELAGLMLKDSGIRQNFNLIIIAIKKPDDTMLFNPSFEAVVQSGDTLIAVGEEANLKKLEKILNPI